MPDKENKTDEKVNPYTTIHMHKTTKERIQKIKGKGLSWDRFMNEHFPPKERKGNERKEKD